MKRPFAIIGILIIILAFLFYSSGIGIEINIDEKEKTLDSEFMNLGDIELTKIDENVWVHTSYIDYEGVRTPSNGLIVVTTEGLLLIDTPWNDKQTKNLIDAAEDKFNQPFVKAVFTHAHSDRMGGVNELIKANIETYSISMTADLAANNGYHKPKVVIESDDMISFGNLSFEIFYPGEGHSKDNIVVWIPEKKILYAGCLVKSLEATNLGNLTDSNVKEWSISLERIKRKYEAANMIIPGHGMWGDVKLIEHTLKLLKE